MKYWFTVYYYSGYKEKFYYDYLSFAESARSNFLEWVKSVSDIKVSLL